MEITDFKPLIRVIWGISGVPRPETKTVFTYAGKGTKTKAQEHKTVDRHYLGKKVSMVNECIRAGYIWAKFDAFMLYFSPNVSF